LRQYGESLGLAFQLQDDLMDAFPPANFGKQVGGDIIENKKTFLLLKALEKANASQREKIASWLERSDAPETKVAEILSIFRAQDIEQETQQLIDSYFHAARQLGKELQAGLAFGPIQDYLGVIANRQV
ncbi:MAG: polyprenyl synthetase family protein, partial [Bacteroidota bacterium]